MLSNNSIVSVFTKEPLTTKDGRQFGWRCNISQSYAKKDKDGNVIFDANGKRTYVKDFSGNVKFLGEAATFIESKNPSKEHPLRIRIDNMGVKTFTVDKEENGIVKKQYFTDILVFGASDLEDNSKSTNVNSQYTPDDNLPFD